MNMNFYVLFSIYEILYVKKTCLSQQKKKKESLVLKWFLLIYKYLKGECHLPINLKRWESHFIHGLGKKIYKKIKYFVSEIKVWEGIGLTIAII